MKKTIALIAIAVCCLTQAAAQMKNYASLANYDESKVPAYTLPDPLICEDGERVTTVAQWEQKRRPEILRLFTTYMYGAVPASAQRRLEHSVESMNAQALGGKATRREVTIHLTDRADGPQLHLQIYLPNQPKGKVPLFLGISFLPNFTVYDDPDLSIPATDSEALGWKIGRGSMSESWQLDDILAHGYGLATFCYTDIAPDKHDDFQTGIYPYYNGKKNGQTLPNPDEWGAIAAWAWGMSRAMDYLETDERVDASKVAVIGHSRLGKTAVWAGAADPRFALVISGNSGCCGVALSRRHFGETVEAMNVRFPHWFCGNYKQFNEREAYMPFDQHELVALIAPRPIYIASAEEDNWADQRGEFLGGKGAEPVYALYGLEGIGTDEMPPVDTPYASGSIAYHNRKGPHAVLKYDWDQFLRFADRFFK